MNLFMKKIMNLRHGIIDLMIENDDNIIIIDYKLKNIDDDAYKKQLEGYKEIIEKRSNKKIELYLYSILDETYKDRFVLIKIKRIDRVPPVLIGISLPDRVV